MLQLILKSHFAFVLIPLFTLAIEPNNPVIHCDRFLGDADKAACIAKTEKHQADWYASSACSLQEDDQSFLKCLDEIQGGDYHPAALDLCAHAADATDATRLQCLQKIKNKDYTRLQIKKCAEGPTAEQVTTCLAAPLTAKKDSARSRKPASKAPVGFQPLETSR